MIFPVDIKIEDDLTLQNIEEILPWYSEINPKRTVEIINYMKNKVQNGNQIFYDIQIKGIQDYFSLKERPEQKRHVKTWQEQLLFCMNIKKRLSDVYSTYVIDALSDGRQRSL